MMLDTTLKLKGIKILLDGLGDLDTEKFLALMRQDPFDYMEWQKDLWSDKSVSEISSQAMKHRSGEIR
jgi:hypothetical protein